jgi:hypothetical protein
MTPIDPAKPSADDILAKVDRLLKRDQPAATPSEDVPTLSEVLVPGTHTRSMATLAAPSIDPAKLVQAITREWLPVLEAKVAEDVRRRLIAELSQSLSHAVQAAVQDVRNDINQTLEAAVTRAVNDVLKK